jgi:hypothetical protein
VRPHRSSHCSVKLVFLAAVLAVFASTFSAAPFVLVGPLRYVRDTKKSGPVTQTFSVSNPSAPYTMRIEELGGPVNAVVTLNGVVIFTPKDFNSKGARLTKSVKLQPHNLLAVEMKGRPGESLAIEVIAVDIAGPAVSASLANSPPGSGS